MSDEAVRTGRGTARFHFDPDFDPSTAPPKGAVVEAAVAVLRADGPARRSVLASAGLLSRSAGPGWRALRTLGVLIPPLARFVRAADERRSEKACEAEVRRHAGRMEQLGREFGVDPSSHPAMSGSFAGVVALAAALPFERDSWKAVLDPLVRDTPAALGLAADLEAMDAERRIEEAHAAMRIVAECEAGVNLMASPALRSRPERLAAAMRSAAEEFRMDGASAAALGLAERLER